MRVIAGSLRGRRLTTVKGLAVRPTTDRAKQVIFDVLSTRFDFDGADVLDVFAGSGSLGIEAISRGAASVQFVERSADALQALEVNTRTLGIGKLCTLTREDVSRFIAGSRRAYDLVFADPPYDLVGIETLADVIGRSGVVKTGGWVVMEHRSSSRVEPDPGLFRTIRKELGQTIALIMHYDPSPPGGEEHQ